MNKTDISIKKTYSNKLLILLSAVILLLICIIVIHFQIIRMQDSDSIRINLAGRQRMLTQKLSKEILQYSNKSISKVDFLQTIEIFDTTLRALLDGGDVTLDLDFQAKEYLMPVKNDVTRNQLLQVSLLWEEFQQNVVFFSESNDPAALEYILNNNIALLEKMDAVVLNLQLTAEKNNQKINIILYSTYLLIFIIFAVLTINAIIQLKSAATYISQLEKFIPICAKCKKIREPDGQADNQKSWTGIEKYIEEHTESKFSHGLCPDCTEEIYGKYEWYKRQKRKNKPGNNESDSKNDQDKN